jgi:hypothetical protein
MMPAPEEKAFNHVLDNEPDKTPDDNKQSFSPGDFKDAIVILLAAGVKEPSCGPDDGDLIQNQDFG